MSHGFFGTGRRISSIKKGRLSLSETENTPPALLKVRMQNSRRNTNTMQDLSDVTLHEEQRRHTQSMHAVVVPEEVDMPSAEEVNSQFEKVLEQMAMAPAQKDKLRLQDVEKKWDIIQAHAKRMNAGPKRSLSTDQRSAQYWIKKMRQKNENGSPMISLNDSLAMQSVFRTSHKDFLADFLEGFAGVRAMNNVAAYFTNLANKSAEEVQILSNLIESYKLLMNNEMGMKGVLLVPESIKTLATAMDFLGNNHQITEKVVTLLSVACWWDEEGRKSVMEAMKYVKLRNREYCCFLSIVHLFQHNDNVSFKASIATFITTVCNTPPTIELRVSVRNYFFRLDIIKVFENVLAKAPQQPESPEEEAAWNTIQTQYEVFRAMMTQDQKIIVHKLIRAADADDSHFDLSKLSDSWKLLQKNALKADCEDQLLNVVQALYLVPTVYSLAAPIYESISKYIFEATSIEKLMNNGDESRNINEAPELNFEELGKLLKKKIEYDAKVEVFAEKEGLMKRQQRLIKVLQKRLVDVSKGVIDPKDATNLQEVLLSSNLLPQGVKSKLQRAKTGLNGAASGGEGNGTGTGMGGPAPGMKVDLSLLAGLGLADTSNEIEIMKEREAKFKKEIEELQKKVDILSKGGTIDPSKLNTSGGGSGGAVAVAVDPNDPIKSYTGKLDSTGLVPAGIAPGKTKRDPPPVPKPGMPGSLENAPTPVESKKEEKPALNLPFGKPPGGANGAGGLAAMFAQRGAQMAAKPKPKVDKNKEALMKLGLEMKQTIKPKVKMIQVFWSVIAPDKLEGTVWPEMSDQNVKFNAEELEKLFAKKAAAEKKTVEKKSDKPDLVKLIDGKRRQNLAIALKKVKLENADMSKAILEVDQSILTPDKLQVFIDMAPNADELTLLDNHLKSGSTADKLEMEEQFLHEMSQIPNLVTRLECIKTAYTFANDAKRIYSVCMRMKAALKEINTSKDLREILEVVLAVGNYMNGGTARGGAFGYKLDILGSLINVKDALNNGTLVHYLYILFERNYPHLLNFNLPASGDVVSISFKETAGEMNALAKQINTLKQEIKKKPFSKQDKFRKTLQPFEVKAVADVEKLQKMLEDTRQDFQTLAVKYAESGNDVEPSTFFPKIVSFEQSLKRAGGELIEMREKEIRRQQVEESKAERQTMRKLKKLMEATKDQEGNLDMGLIHAFKESQSGKANQVVDRFLEKYKRDLERRKKQARSKKRPAY